MLYTATDTILDIDFEKKEFKTDKQAIKYFTEKYQDRSNWSIEKKKYQLWYRIFKKGEC